MGKDCESNQLELQWRAQWTLRGRSEGCFQAEVVGFNKLKCQEQGREGHGFPQRERQ